MKQFRKKMLETRQERKEELTLNVLDYKQKSKVVRLLKLLT